MPTLRARVLTPIGPDAIRWHEDANVVIEGGKIAAIEAGTAAADLDVRPGVLIPGFVDTHVHYPQTRIVGSATGPLLDWLARSTFPEEARFENRVHAERIASIFATQLVSAGTTLSLVYGPVFPDATDALFREFDRRGLKTIAGPVLMDENCPPELRLDAAVALVALEGLIERWHNHDGRLRVAVVPRFALCCSMGLMRGAAELARTRGLTVTTHLSENVEECRIARERFGTTDYLQVYEKAGLLQAGAVFAHCIHMSDDELHRMAVAQAVIAHCPDSNRFLGSGGMPISRMMAHNLTITAGTDIAAGRSFRVGRILSDAYDNALADGVELDPRRLLWWGTRGAALALRANDTGALAPGLDADMQLVDVPEWAITQEQVLAAILFDHDAPRPRKTWVRGKVVWDREAAGAFPWWKK